MKYSECELMCYDVNDRVRNYTQLLTLSFVERIYILSLHGNTRTHHEARARGQIINGSRAFINGSVVSTENQPASSRSGQMTARSSWYNDIFFLLTRGQSQVSFSISSPRPLYFSFFYEPYVIEAFRASPSSNKRKPTGIQSTTGHI